MLVEAGSGSSSTDQSYESDRRLCLWPLPPSGPFDFVIEWHSMGIGTPIAALDGSAILRAAKRAQPYWP
jgi:hypothetical protein